MANVTPAPKLFQLPPSHEGEQLALVVSPGKLHFNSRPRMRANAKCAAIRARNLRFQLPPSHEGERTRRQSGQERFIISTPALA